MRRQHRRSGALARLRGPKLGEAESAGRCRRSIDQLSDHIACRDGGRNRTVDSAQSARGCADGDVRQSRGAPNGWPRRLSRDTGQEPQDPDRYRKSRHEAGRGSPSARKALALVAAGRRPAPVVEYADLQCLRTGNLQHLESPNEAPRQLTVHFAPAGRVSRSLHKARSRTARSFRHAGTSTFDIDPDAHVLTELRVGSSTSSWIVGIGAVCRTGQNRVRSRRRCSCRRPSSAPIATTSPRRMPGSNPLQRTRVPTRHVKSAPDGTELFLLWGRAGQHSLFGFRKSSCHRTIFSQLVWFPTATQRLISPIIITPCEVQCWKRSGPSSISHLVDPA